MESKFGFTFKNSVVTIVEKLYVPAFQDPARQYVIKLDGEIKDSIFENLNEGINEDTMWMINL